MIAQRAVESSARALRLGGEQAARRAAGRGFVGGPRRAAPSTPAAAGRGPARVVASRQGIGATLQRAVTQQAGQHSRRQARHYCPPQAAAGPLAARARVVRRPAAARPRILRVSSVQAVVEQSLDATQTAGDADAALYGALAVAVPTPRQFARSRAVGASAPAAPRTGDPAPAYAPRALTPSRLTRHHLQNSATKNICKSPVLAIRDFYP